MRHSAYSIIPSDIIIAINSMDVVLNFKLKNKAINVARKLVNLPELNLHRPTLSTTIPKCMLKLLSIFSRHRIASVILFCPRNDVIIMAKTLPNIAYRL